MAKQITNNVIMMLKINIFLSNSVDCYAMARIVAFNANKVSADIIIIIINVILTLCGGQSEKNMLKLC